MPIYTYRKPWLTRAEAFQTWCVVGAFLLSLGIALASGYDAGAVLLWGLGTVLVVLSPALLVLAALVLFLVSIGIACLMAWLLSWV